MEQGYAALHARLVAGVRARTGQFVGSSVWLEHSYARTQCGKDVRAIVGPVGGAAGATGGGRGEVDVCRCSPSPPPLPGDEDTAAAGAAADMAGEEDDDWEARALTAAGPTFARAVRGAVRALYALRLQRLLAPAPGGGAGRIARQQQATDTAHRLRQLLAPLWLSGGGGAVGAGAGSSAGGAGWVLHVVSAHAPPYLRALLDETLGELRVLAPRLAARLPVGGTPAAPPWPPGDGPPLPGAETRPLLAWAPCGSLAADARWLRRLRALLDVRPLVTRAPAAAAPEQWAAAWGGAARKTLAEALQECGERGVVLAGCGGGAALAVALASALGTNAAALRGLALLAPPPRTAEGALTLPEALPTLVVADAAGARWLSLGARRVRLVAGADPLLRLPARRRRRLQLPQPALDAAICEEVVSWCEEVCLCSTEAEEGEGEYAHLPPPPLVPSPPESVELMAGRVARVSGRTPLTLAPPLPHPPRPALQPQDILQLPIVFADDAVSGSGEGGEEPVTVTSGGSGSGGVQYRRVLVAKRRPPAPPAPPALVIRRRGGKRSDHSHYTRPDNDTL